MNCILFLTVAFSLGSSLGENPFPRPCKQDEYHYQYTVCDENNRRWKVAVPNTTCSGNLPDPVLGTKCNFGCSEGTYLELKSETCRPCPAGTYSLGGGHVFEDFDKIPSEFTVSNDNAIRRLFSDSFDDSETETSCINAGWSTMSGYLVYVPSVCLSTLSYSVQLVRPGNATFTYLYPDNGVTFTISVQNAQCEKTDLFDRSRVIKSTQDGKWKTKSVYLPRGQALITWKGFAPNGAQQPVLIKKIEIIGVAYTQQCTPCPSGTYSSGNSKTCSQCDPGSYSQKGSSKCFNCDLKTSFSDYRASICSKRPPCTKSDFVEFVTCDTNGKTKTEARWLEPKICRDDLPNAVTLKAEDSYKNCDPCNPGMELKNSKCQFCNENYYSYGNNGCQKCPLNSWPNYGYQLVSWFNLPDSVKAECQQTEDTAPECRNVTSWVLGGDCIHTASVRRKDIYFLLTVSVTGFKNPFLNGQPSERNPIARVSFEFDTVCAGIDCAVYFFHKDDTMSKYYDELVTIWNGTLEKQTFSYPIVRNAKNTQFVWLFIRSQLNVGNLDKEAHLKDRFSIYSINITNTIGGGASSCIPCPITGKQECSACPDGHYMNESNRQCVQCPKNTYLNISTSAVGPKACAKCGPNLNSDKGVDCGTDCRLNISGKSFDLSKLKGFYQAKAVQVFGGDVRYYHTFNISVCSTENVRCTSSSAGTEVTENNELEELSVSSAICRLVSIPRGSKVSYFDPIEIGNILVGVSDQLTFPDFEVPRNVVATWRYSELYFLYRTSSGSSPSCRYGRSTLLVFRCDPGQNQTHIELPAACPDGTCDGCLFQIIITSRHACPLCTKADYSEVVGECHLGQQTVHYIPAKLCVLAGEDQLKTITRKCQLLSFEVEVVIGFAAAIAATLTFVVVFVWKKNKRLEYKYMKLVEASSGKEGELPAAESCALHDDEDEEDSSDRVVFAKGGKKTGWFSGRGGKKGNYDNTEHSALTLGSEMDD